MTINCQMNIGNTIKEIRKRKGFSQQELAKKSEVSQTYLSQIENGERNPTLEVLQKISVALDIPFPVLSFLTLEHTDISEDKIEAYKRIEPVVSSLIKEFFLQ